MKIISFERFQSQYNGAPLVSAYAEVMGDMDTPVSTFLKTAQKSYRFLLESVEGGTQRGRYSIIGDTPLLIFQSKNGITTIRNTLTGKTTTHRENPFDVLKTVLSTFIHRKLENSPFLNGGLFGYIGYDAIRYIEKIPSASEDDMALPDIHLFLPQNMIVFDNLLNRIHLIHFMEPGADPKIDYQKAVGEIEENIQKIQNTSLRNGKPAFHEPQAFTSNIEKKRFETSVQKAREHIYRGDIFQMVLSQRLSVPIHVPPFEIYRALRMINPSPYMFYMDMEDITLLGASPETLVKLEGDTVLVKPIAGTRKRGRNETEDLALVEDLLADPKERAEHIMLVDLERNDVGRIAEFGSVTLEDFMIIEKYSHVMHIVSTVTGKLRQGLDAVDVFRACFPAGTVSGAPKVRAMELIEEMEPTRRGIYAGAVGYFAFDRTMDVCIAIRTIVVKNGKAYVQAGAGIVADSVPSSEYEETLNKARGLLKAIESAEGGLT
ncbi:MAG: anthranilate synthase component I [Calditrichaeota bacterium]|nr:anthranilate synthase component I [Calditrichota bacterium]